MTTVETPAKIFEAKRRYNTKRVALATHVGLSGLNYQSIYAYYDIKRIVHSNNID